MFCNMCPLIPTLADFQKRAWHSRDMVVPRGERSIQSGIHLDYLQREELITSAREWEMRANACSGQVFMMNLALTRATTAHKDLT